MLVGFLGGKTSQIIFLILFIGFCLGLWYQAKWIKQEGFRKGARILAAVFILVAVLALVDTFLRF